MKKLRSIAQRWFSSGGLHQTHRTMGLYLRALAIVYFVAFLSLAIQIRGLVGSRGVLPVGAYLASAQDQSGDRPFWQLPTLCWLDDSDAFLVAQCVAGMLLAVVAALGLLQPFTFALLWLLYLSLTVAGQDFLSFQWDNLLLEAGLLAIFLSPVRVVAWRGGWPTPSPVMVWLQRGLIFKLMFLSGVVKLSSGDPTWRDGTAMTYHYWTQPIPTWTSWYAAQLPSWFSRWSVTGVLIIELLLPFLMFGPRRLRWVAAGSTVFLQLLIAATGNYGFFNLLAIVLCIPLLDDALLSRWGALPTATDAATTGRRDVPRLLTNRHLSVWVTAPLAAVVAAVGLVHIAAAAGFGAQVPAPLAALAQSLAPLRSINGYGLFASMTTDRPELIVEGSDDGLTWKAYEFKWKPGDVRREPTFCTPHMPRLDWQMWFAALSPSSNGQMLEGLERALLEGSPQVRRLLAVDPFPQKPPRSVRLHLYRYRFSTPQERRHDGSWWQRLDTRQQSQAVSLN